MTYTGLPTSLPRARAQLASVVARAGDLVRIDDAVEALSLSRADAAKRLSSWTAQGWLRRVGRGIYAPVSLDTLDAARVLDDPWVLVPALYAPAYIGGRTAAEHWDLTEQIFDDIVVVTAQPVRERRQARHGARFTLSHRREDKFFGTKPVWRHHTKVPVSDVYRTIVDMLDEPSLGGGIQQVSDCLRAYLKRKDRDDRRLIDYAARLGNGAVFKRLGFLAESEDGAATLAEQCVAHLTAGNARLDPALDCPRLITRWRLFVPLSRAKAPAR
jgi:predicted transcriptional regulator of viral defense system